MPPDSIVAPDGSSRTVERCPLLAQRLRAARTDRELSLRMLASRIGVSASLISQIETGKVQPSVNTLYALANELGLSVDELLFPEDHQRADERATERPQVGHRGQRTVIELNEGVRWERLTTEVEPGFDFLEIVYEPGGESGPAGAPHRHQGREWGYVLSGTLHVELGDDTYVLGPGDTISFTSTTPHRLSNPGDEPVHGIWFVLGRAGDPRLPDPS